MQYAKSLTHKLSSVDRGWTEGEKENLMHLALNMSRYVLGFLFDLSHWRLFTNVLYSHKFELRQMTFADMDFGLTCLGEWGLPQMTVPESSTFCSWKSNLFDFDWNLNLIIWNVLMEETYIFSHTFFVLAYILYANSRQTFFLSTPTCWNTSHEFVHVCLSVLECDKDFIFLFQSGEKGGKMEHLFVFGFFCLYFNSALKFLSNNASGFYFPVWF